MEKVKIVGTALAIYIAGHLLSMYDVTVDEQRSMCKRVYDSAVRRLLLRLWVSELSGLPRLLRYTNTERAKPTAAMIAVSPELPLSLYIFSLCKQPTV